MEIDLDEDDIYWIESRPAEKGRSVIVRRASDGRLDDITPAQLNARTRVHEYGGGSYCVSDKTIYFSNFTDQRLYRRQIGADPTPITPQADVRYADAIIDPRRNLLICVREDHTGAGKEPVNTIVCIELNQSTETDKNHERILVGGSDFYSSPRLNPDRSKIAWLCWNHPNMPWDGTELWMADINEDGSLCKRLLIAGGRDESIFQPEWSPDGVLHFVSDRTGWWNLYRYSGNGIEALCPMEAEFGLPQWVFGMSCYAFLSDNLIICAFIEEGFSNLGLIDAKHKTFERIESTYSRIEDMRAMNGKAVFIAASPAESANIVGFDPAAKSFEIIRRSSDSSIDPGYISIPEAIEFPTQNGLTAHAFFYPPHNKDFAAPHHELPPLVVMSHGGPTSAASAVLRPGIQYWTSRGIAVLDVNYGGSTGYGREYRDRLKGNWGVVDVDDCVNGAQYLARRGLVDGDRMAITGGSAGGYTTLCALTFRDVFKAGASYYGVSDLEALEVDTHKFESRYTHSLVAPYPERADLYRERSPINHTDRLKSPVIFFQGLEDRVVPPNQSEMMVEALRAKKLPVAYITYEGEQHGFRQAANIKRSLEAELYFYSRIFGFDIADEIEPVKIENAEEER